MEKETPLEKKDTSEKTSQQDTASQKAIELAKKARELAELETKIKKLKESIEAEKYRIAYSERKQRDRQRYLVGSMVLEGIRNEKDRADLLDRLNIHLKRNTDRVIFGLEKIQEETKE